MVSEQFTDKEKAILSQFCTNLESDCFVLINLPEAVKGALFSRYSRSAKSLRRVLLEEFIQDPESGFDAIVGLSQGRGASQLVATKKAEDFYDRVLVGYGDDSVAELGGAHLAAENISNLVTKVMQDSRIGISPLEKSTRYVYFDQKPDGKYRYLREERIMSSKFAEEYIRVCDLLFDTYASLIVPLTELEQKKNPRAPDTSDRAYAATIRAKVCDLLRGILPAATLTNAGFYGNGRAFEYLLSKMYASPLSEARAVARASHTELSKVIPSFVKRADDKYGKEAQGYITVNREAISKLAAAGNSQLQAASQDTAHVTLVDYDKDAEDKIVTAILFANSHAEMNEVKAHVAKMPHAEKEALLLAYIGTRANRRQKPGRAFEAAFYTFCVTGNFGMYRDLHRHRILTQERQLLTTKHGFDMPQELVDAGFGDKVAAAVAAADSLFSKMVQEMPNEAQYVVPLGCRMRWYVKMNLREAYHFCELRSMRQGHIDYRRVAQDMHKLILQVHPLLGKGMKFVDYGSYDLERLESEKKIDKKLDALKQKKD
ncbi:MAG: FAD-dependent thymidylate synthase [Candidatus Micrarchaeota archaeon]|nr:FAD-dependent thymidylate synthase [Candidatus Micrarchaeota archaeon]